MAVKNKLSAVALLLDDSRGIYIPRDFVTGFNLADWSLAEDDPDVLACQDPDCEWYWDAWNNICNKAVYKDTGHTLYQDGDLWALNVDEMTCEEKDNFGFDVE